MKKLTETEKAYLAGLLDGDGEFSKLRGKMDKKDLTIFKNAL